MNKTGDFQQLAPDTKKLIQFINVEKRLAETRRQMLALREKKEEVDVRLETLYQSHDWLPG